MTQQADTSAQRILDAVSKVVTGLIVIAVGWTANELTDLKERVSIIEANRYTTRDAMDLERDVNVKLSNMSKEISVIVEILSRVEARIKEQTK